VAVVASGLQRGSTATQDFVFSFVGPAGQQHEDVRRRAFVFFIFMKMIAVHDLHVVHGKGQ
jgi:hypothetical protein